MRIICNISIVLLSMGFWLFIIYGIMANMNPREGTLVWCKMNDMNHKSCAHLNISKTKRIGSPS
jgi:hypothetical protein